jgi:hypothetical protein
MVATLFLRHLEIRHFYYSYIITDTATATTATDIFTVVASDEATSGFLLISVEPMI